MGSRMLFKYGDGNTRTPLILKTKGADEFRVELSSFEISWSGLVGWGAE